MNGDTLLHMKVILAALRHCLQRGRVAAELPDWERRVPASTLAQRHVGEAGLDLDGLWQGLGEVDGMSEVGAAAVIAALASLQPVLGVPMRRSKRLEALGEARRRALLAECPVDRGELEGKLALLRGAAGAQAQAKSTLGTVSEPQFIGQGDRSPAVAPAALVSPDAATEKVAAVPPPAQTAKIQAAATKRTPAVPEAAPQASERAGKKIAGLPLQAVIGIGLVALAALAYGLTLLF
jgi:hypothetical protein